MRVLLVVIGVLGTLAAGYGMWQDGFSGMRLIELVVAISLVFAPRLLAAGEREAD
ncbi:MAG: hypothetical protein KDB77_14600 [Flavobacteriales bacterium]|nr:hypothetical protein [Flavobacteriales bacterium]